MLLRWLWVWWVPLLMTAMDDPTTTRWLLLRPCLLVLVGMTTKVYDAVSVR